MLPKAVVGPIRAYAIGVTTGDATDVASTTKPSSFPFKLAVRNASATIAMMELCHDTNSSLTPFTGHDCRTRAFMHVM